MINKSENGAPSPSVYEFTPSSCMIVEKMYNHDYVNLIMKLNHEIVTTD